MGDLRVRSGKSRQWRFASTDRQDVIPHRDGEGGSREARWVGMRADTAQVTRPLHTASLSPHGRQRSCLVEYEFLRKAPPPGHRSPYSAAAATMPGRTGRRMRTREPLPSSESIATVPPCSCTKLL